MSLSGKGIDLTFASTYSKSPQSILDMGFGGRGMRKFSHGLWVCLAAVLFIGCGDASIAADPGEACSVDTDCVAATSCQTGVCDPDLKECLYSVNAGYCLVGSVCHLDGANSEDNKCQVCDSAQDSAAFSAVVCEGDQVCDAGQGCVGKENACAGDDSVCDTGNPCITGTCGDNGLCEETVNDGAACDDKDACTSDDKCTAEGACVGTFTCACTDDSECPAKACQSAVCDQGTCVYTNDANDSTCDDSDACTENDSCTDGVCAGTAMVCDGGDTCNSPVCVDGSCTTKALDPGSACNDEDDCTKDDACDAAGLCVGQWDDQACACQSTADCKAMPPQCEQYVCTGGQCELEPGTDGVACDDANACTTGETCTSGACDGGTAVDCPDDGDPCTFEECDEKNGCGFTIVDDSQTTCDDGNTCTSGDVCTGKQDAKNGCAGEWDYGICECKTVSDCTDNIAQCKQWGCVAGQCVAQDAAGACDDGNACTLNDQCAGGECVAGAVETCTNQAAPPNCQKWACNPNVGCELQNLTDNTDCNDGLFCTVDDKCVNGSCQGGGDKSCTSTDPCQTPWCDEAGDKCDTQQKATGAQCNGMSPSVCLDNFQCTASGECKATELDDCSEVTNPCKVKTCDDTTGCVESGLPNVTNGTKCGTKKACSNGNCASVECNDASDCSAKNECALWSCKSKKCQQTGYQDNGKSCGKSGNLCSQGQCITPACTKDSQCVGDPCKVYECQNYACKQTQSLTSGVCGNKKVCSKGVCTSVQCTEPSHCSSNNPCEIMGCNSSNKCFVSGNQNNGIDCGKSGVCIQGQCETKECNKSSECPQQTCFNYMCTQYNQCVAYQSKPLGTNCKSGKLSGKCKIGNNGIYCQTTSIGPGLPDIPQK